MVHKQRRFWYIAPVIILLIGFVFILSLYVGSVGIHVSDVTKALLGKGNETISIIVLEARMPRVIIALIVGANLGLSGAIIKAVMKNPLADTGLLGIQSGAVSVALLIMLAFPAFSAFLPIGTFLGGIVAYIIVMVLAYKNGINPMRLILAGVAVNALFGAIIGIITIYHSDKLQGALGWLNGTLTNATFEDMQLLLIYSAIALPIGFMTIPKCNLLLLDDEAISNLGFNVNLIRFLIATVAVFISTISVSIVGVIGFVGLVCPHIARLLVGNNYKYMLPISTLLGALLVASADILQKIIFNPVEMPVGIVISLLGAPFFLYLLRKAM